MAWLSLGWARFSSIWYQVETDAYRTYTDHLVQLADEYRNRHLTISLTLNFHSEQNSSALVPLELVKQLSNHSQLRVILI